MDRLGVVKNSVDDACKGCRGVDADGVRGQAFLCRMLESRKGFAFACRSAPRVCRSGGKTPVQRSQIDRKHENAIPHIAETVGIPGTTAKEGCRMGVIGQQSADRRNVPHPGTLRSGAPRNGRAGFWLAPIGQVPVAVDGVVAAPLQFVADCGFTGAGNAVDDVVLATHVPFRMKRR